MPQVSHMNLPVVNAAIARTRQVVQMPLEVASDVANRGLIMPRPYGLGLNVRSMIQNRPRILGLGTSSTAANAGIEKPIRPY